MRSASLSGSPKAPLGAAILQVTPGGKVTQRGTEQLAIARDACIDADGALSRSLPSISFRDIRVQIVAQRRCHVARPAINANSLRQPRHRGAQQGVAFDVDLFTAGETPFEILGQNTGGAEPSDQLPTQFRTQFGAALVDQDGGSDIAKTSSDAEPTISVGQGLRAIRQLVAGIILPPRYPAANRPLLRPKSRPSTPEPPFCRVVSGSSIIGDYAPEPPSHKS